MGGVFKVLCSCPYMKQALGRLSSHSKMPRSRSRSPPRRPREEGSSRYDRQRDSDRAERPRDADRARDNYRERSPPRRNSRSPPPAAAAAPAPRKPRELSMYKRSSGNSFASRRDPLDDMPRKTREEIERQEVPGRYGGSRGQYTGGGSYLSGAGKSDPLDSMAGRRGGDERRSDGPTPTGPRTGPNGGPPERPPAAAPSGPSAAVSVARFLPARIRLTRQRLRPYDRGHCQRPSGTQR